MKKLGFGCMRFPLLDKDDQKSFDVRQIIQMVDTYIAHGFTYFDTAYMYHDYESERIVKEVLVDRYPRDKFLLATKLPTMFLEKEEDMERIFNEQLEKTGAEYFDYYLIHCLDTKLYERLQSLNGFDFVMQKKKEGKIKKLGFSFHDKADVLDKILTEHPETEFVQLQINYLDWDNEDIQSEKCYEVALKHGKEIIIMEPVKGGALANVPPAAERLFKEHNKDMSVPSWAIRFAASLENVSMVLSGMSNMEQMLDNISYMEDFVPLTEEEKKLCFKIAEIINSHISVACTACRYCVEGCPANISIPEYFAIYNKAIKGEDEALKKLREEYNELSENYGKASDCIECRQCEEHCPQHINIVDFLKNVVKVFGK